MHLSLSGPTKSASLYMFVRDSLNYFPELYFLTIYTRLVHHAGPSLCLAGYASHGARCAAQFVNSQDRRSSTGIPHFILEIYLKIRACFPHAANAHCLMDYSLVSQLLVLGLFISRAPTLSLSGTYLSKWLDSVRSSSAMFDWSTPDCWSAFMSNML
jgi:hypothetical protein